MISQIYGSIVALILACLSHTVLLETRQGLGKHQRPIRRGATMTLLGRAGYGHCRVASVLARLSSDGSSVLRQVPLANRGQLAAKRGRMYELHLTSTQPLFLSESDQIPLINRFLLMDSTGMTVGVGEVARQQEMRLPLRILSKSPQQQPDWKKQLDAHFIVPPPPPPPPHTHTLSLSHTHTHQPFAPQRCGAGAP